MRFYHVTFGATCFFLLVNVVAGNDVTVFNHDEYDEENVDTALEKEHFIQVVDRRIKTSPHIKKDTLYVNSSLKVVIPQKPVHLSIPNSRPPSYSEVSTVPTIETTVTVDSSARNISSLKSRTQIQGWSPHLQWDELGKEYDYEILDNGLLEAEENFLSLGNDGSDIALSRARRAAYWNLNYPPSGYDFVQCEIIAVGLGTIMTDDAAQALRDYLRKVFGTNAIEVEVTNIVSINKGRSKISFNIMYPDDDDDIKQKDLALALYVLTKLPLFKIGTNFFKMQKAKMAKTVGSRLIPVFCFLCKRYQTCIEINDEGYCKCNDVRLYPYGIDVGDSTFPEDDEYAIVRILLPYPIAIGKELRKQLFVSANGIAATIRFASNDPVRCSILKSKYPDERFFMPYWTDMDVLTDDYFNQVFTRVLEVSSSRASKDQETFDKADRDIQKYTSERNFKSKIVIVVTWDSLPPFPRLRGEDERATVQLVLISNVQKTYALYIYAQGALTFNSTFQRKIQACVSEVSLDIITRNLYQFDTFKGNTGETGIWAFPVGHVENSRTKCYNWYQSNEMLLPFIDAWNQIVEPCPCSEFQVFLSFRWIPSFLQQRCYDSFPIYGQIGRRCCYRNDGSFENRIPISGNLLLFNPYSGLIVEHQENDAVPKQWCCRDSNLCSLYYRVRPVRTCRGFSWFDFFFNRGFLFGDPHIVTLDKFSYTFNGLGEYTLIDIDGVFNGNATTFTLQGRTCRSRTNNETLTDATVFCALAFRTTNSSNLTVEIHESGQYMILYINNQDYTARYRDEKFYNTSNAGIFIHSKNDSLLISTSDDIGLTIKLHQEFNLLDFSIDIFSKYRNGTKGLLGNFNGNSTDDLIFFNGTVIPSNSSERDIFAFGNSWRINKSVFTYQNGQNSSSFYFPNFVPIFLDEFNTTQKDTAAKLCGTDQACIYDFLATGNVSLARSTNEAITEFTDVDKRLQNSPPVINTTLNLNFTVNETTTFYVTAVDPDNDLFNFSILETPKFGFTSSDKNGTLTASYMPTDLSEFNISLLAQDSKGDKSELAKFTITVCSGCTKQGQCIFEETLPSNNAYFSLATCNCSIGYSGDHCEKDTNGCENNPCPSYANCTYVSASEENINKSFTCIGCPEGLQFNSTVSKCDDIDECATTPDKCGKNSTCTNIYGSYTCGCVTGYRKSSSGVCLDINDCVENQNDCTQKCTNTDGGYECDCFVGFVKKFLNDSCVRSGEDPCKGLLQPQSCAYSCANVSGVAKCLCQIGYKLNSDGFSCSDINECKENLCAQNCNNTAGSYTCSCLPGYQLSKDKLSCDKCPEGSYGTECKEICDCVGHYTSCDHIKGCLCVNGWTGTSCDIDINECDQPIDLCFGDSICSNTNGSYDCVCAPGYEIKNGTTNTCININECKDVFSSECPYSELCKDSIGSFTCGCPDGYMLVNKKCEDINECAMNISGCHQKCVNMPGSFNCECPSGYMLDFDRRSCIIDPNKIPCPGFNKTCGHFCELINGLPLCSCRSGFKLGTDNRSCFDIDECVAGLHNCTDNCANTFGSYNCTCSLGTKLEVDRRTCSACDAFHWGQECSNDCACSPKGSSRCDPKRGCKCISGWAGKFCDVDFNECNSNKTLCPAPATCVNTLGSFFCRCLNGYEFNSSGQCTDIDECAKQSPCDQICTNTIGSYSCSCLHGFNSIGDICEDINECLKPELSNCDQMCRNTIGGFTCECYENYVLNTTTRNTCDKLNDTSQCNCSHICAVVDGKDVCLCRDGYQLSKDNFTCENINECINSTGSPCINGSCTDLEGSFACNCSDGFKLDSSQLVCRECDNGFYGKNCSKKCNCSITNTKKCLAVDGRCECHMGWNGTTCSEDIDECLNKTFTNCGPNSYCVNTPPGSYKCLCNTGYFPIGNGTCRMCDVTRYGIDCQENCKCVQENTQDCNNVNGVCTCSPGWTGAYCDQKFSSEEIFILWISLAYSEIDKIKLGDIFNTNSQDFKVLSMEIQVILIKFGQYIFLSTVVSSVEVTNFYNGSLVANTSVGINTNVSRNASYDLNKFAEQVARNGSLPIKGENIRIIYVKTDNKTYCSGVNEYYGENCTETCRCIKENTQTCAETDGTCTCKSSWTGVICDKHIEDNTNLIIGLAVGLSLFIILVIIVALLAVLYVRRRRKRQQLSSNQSVDNMAPFRTQFPTRVSTKGSWGAPFGLNAPDGFSEVSTNGSGVGGIIRTRPKGSSGFNDSPWYDNKGATPAPESRESSTEVPGPTSNFSWEYMFRLLEPHRDFEIQRPVINSTPNPTFDMGSNGAESSD